MLLVEAHEQATVGRGDRALEEPRHEHRLAAVDRHAIGGGRPVLEGREIDLASAGRYPDAVARGMTSLAEFGWQFPDRPDEIYAFMGGQEGSMQRWASVQPA